MYDTLAILHYRGYLDNDYVWETCYIHKYLYDYVCETCHVSHTHTETNRFCSQLLKYVLASSLKFVNDVFMILERVTILWIVPTSTTRWSNISLISKFRQRICAKCLDLQFAVVKLFVAKLSDDIRDIISSFSTFRRNSSAQILVMSDSVIFDIIHEMSELFWADVTL